MTKYSITSQMHEFASEYAEAAVESLMNTSGFFEPTGNYEEDKALRMEAMYWGKIGELAVAQWMSDNNIVFQGDPTPENQADDFDFVVKGLTIDVKTERSAMGYLTISNHVFEKGYMKDIYISVEISDSDEVFIMGWAWKEDFANDKISFTTNGRFGPMRQIDIENLRDLPSLSSLLETISHVEYTTLSNIVPAIDQNMDSLSDSCLICSPSCIAAIWKNDMFYTIYIASPNFQDDISFYHFYLGHKIDCLDEITTYNGHNILIYPNCSLETSKIILSSAFHEDDIVIETLDENADIETLVDEHFVG